MRSDLGVGASEEEVNQLLQEMQDTEVPVPKPVPATNHLGSGTSTWYKGHYPLCRRPPHCVQLIYKEWNETESGNLEINTYSISGHVYLLLTS